VRLVLLALLQRDGGAVEIAERLESLHPLGDEIAIGQVPHHRHPTAPAGSPRT
jgi:hypothetical protein